MIGISVLAIPALLITACGGTTPITADFQVDVSGAPLSDTDIVRVCATPGVSKEEALGHGRVAVAGLSQASISVQIQHNNGGAIAGQTDPIVLDADQPWAETTWKTCADDCMPCTSTKGPQSAEDRDALLVVNFTD